MSVVICKTCKKELEINDEDMIAGNVICPNCKTLNNFSDPRVKLLSDEQKTHER